MQSLEAQALVQESIGEQNQGKSEDRRCAANIVEDGPSMPDLLPISRRNLFLGDIAEDVRRLQDRSVIALWLGHESVETSQFLS
jgi:hypothetical protein